MGWRRVALIGTAAVTACSSRDEPARREPPLPPPVMAPVRPDAAPPPAQAHVDVNAGVVAMSISIETIGGVASVIIPRDTPLPFSHSEAFSTAADDQSSVEVHIVQGERPLARDNHSLGKFVLSGIPPAPRGVPQIDVTFEVDAAGVLAVSARDRATGAERAIRIEASGPIDPTLADATAPHGDDAMKRQWAEARTELDGLLYSTKKLLAESGDRLPAAIEQDCDRAVGAAEAVMTATASPGDPMLIRAARDRLREAAHVASAALYSAAPVP